ncbi:MAG TPA: YkvA family protein [Ktedonobacterales bacterium]|jgi:uncharacterized membrane protein YkvA (DUF1232 family)|nr:YkvA family protein [Ktedonobacterales bacterium]
MRFLDSWKQRAGRLKRETYALYLAMRDPRVPWYVKALAACVVGYAFSPIDLIPDFIPVLGYLDDLILVPLGVALVVKLIPAPLLAEFRERAAATLQGKTTNWAGARAAAIVIVALWVIFAIAIAAWVLRLIGG